MDSTHARACPSCAAIAQTSQRWCLECGSELPAARSAGLRPLVGIATTLAVLVGAASAGGYTLLAHDKLPPPPATTVAAATPPATTTPPSTPPTPVQTPLVPPSRPTTLPSFRPHVTGGSSPAHITIPTTPSRSGSVQPRTLSTTPTSPAPAPQLALTNVALGAAAVVYAPYVSSDVDLGDASRVVDGTTRTTWRTPTFSDSSASPQLGLYVDLATAQKLRKLVIETPTPGLRVEIYGAAKGPPAAITDAGWDHLATRADLKSRTTVGLPSRAYRYVLVWIVGLPPGGTRAAISELSLLSLQPE